jgi:hypothetical protein
MTVKIKQLIVKGTLKETEDNSTENVVEKSSIDDKLTKLKNYVDKTVDASFKEVCDSTTNLILENIEKKSDF